MKKHEPTINASDVNTDLSKNLVGETNIYKENDVFFNPFMLGIRLWQNYSAIWMNFCKELLNHTARTTRNFIN